VKWSLSARVGSKMAKQFAMNKTAQKVNYNAAQTPADPESDNTGGNGGNGGSDENLEG